MSVQRIVSSTAALLVYALVILAAPPRVAAQGTRVTLPDAIRQGIITADLHGSGELFFQQSLSFRFQNQKTTPVTIVIPLGLILDPNDSSYQSLIIAREVAVNLAANGTAEGKAFAFCINLSKHAPDENTSYHVGQLATGPLAQVIQSVDKKAGAGRLGGQFAIWRVTDDFTLESLNSSEIQNSDLVQLIAPLLSLARPEIDLSQDILADSNTGLKFYNGTPPPNLFEPGGLLSPGTSTGIPEVDALKRQIEDALRSAAIAGTALVAICGLACVGLVGLIVLFGVVLRRK